MARHTLHGDTGTTYGSPNNHHMQALLARASREGITVEHHAA